jgi:hypothetical protein
MKFNVKYKSLKLEIMKTLKLALVATIVAFTMVSVSYADGVRSNPKFKRVINVTLENAIKNPELVRAMYDQLSLADVFDVHQFNNAEKVIVKGITYCVYGSNEDWKRFFLQEGTPQLRKARIEITE